MTEAVPNEHEDRDRAFARSVFNAADWGLCPVVAWIGFRNADHITKISSKSDLGAFKIFPSHGPTMIDACPDRTLLEMLKNGKLEAIKDGATLAAEAWFGKDVWSHGEIFFRRKDVLTLWADSTGPINVGAMGTGLAGRPSSWYLMEAECRRRWAANQDHQIKKTEWARNLIAWLKEAHPNAPPPTEKTVTNHLTDLLRELRAASNSPQTPEIK